jgi:carboxymethylenebutenolidase
MDLSTPRRLTAADFDQELLILFDAYVHGEIDRRGFLDQAARFAVGGVTAAGLLAALSPDFAIAQVVPQGDPRIRTERISYDAPNGSGPMKAYVAKPANATGRLPAVLVVHENRGLNPHIEDITRRMALAGYLAFAPDALYPLGGYPGDEDSARTEFAKLDQSKTREDMVAAAEWLQAHADGNGKLGVVGFCYGGAIANLLATRLPELKAAVPFYGGAAPLDQVGKIQAELLVVLAADDDRVNAGWPAYQAALDTAGVRYRMIQPPGTLHGFNNDTTPRYEPEAAALAWGETLALFERTLR